MLNELWHVGDYWKGVAQGKEFAKGWRDGGAYLRGWVAHGANELVNTFLRGEPAPLYAHNLAPPDLQQAAPSEEVKIEPMQVNQEVSSDASSMVPQEERSKAPQVRPMDKLRLHQDGVLHSDPIPIQHAKGRER